MADLLIVDDNILNRRILCRSLRGEDHQITEASNGQEALDCVRQHHPDLILLDVMMPVMDGIACCQALQRDRSTRHIPVLLVTSLDDEKSVVSGLDSGAIDYITRPFQEEVVLARVRTALRIRHDYDRAEKLSQMLGMQNERLSESTRVAHQFVDDVSHEFRTPLTVIDSYAAIIVDGLAGPVADEQLQHLNVIRSAVQDLTRMVDDMLDSSKIKGGTLRIDRQPVNVDEIMGSIRTMLTAKAETKGINIKEDIASDLPEAFADIDLIGRVLINLVVNAIKFSPDDSSITIWAKHDETNADMIRFGVTDEGPGLPAADLSKLFDRFEQVGTQTESSTKGFGLGLSIAKNLVWLNLGEINVQSELGDGSSFSFTVPSANPAAIIGAYCRHLAEKSAIPASTITCFSIDVPTPQISSEQVRTFLTSNCYPMDLFLDTGNPDALMAIGVSSAWEIWIERIKSVWLDRYGGGILPLRIDEQNVYIKSFDKYNADRSAKAILDIFSEVKAYG